MIFKWSIYGESLNLAAFNAELILVVRHIANVYNTKAFLTSKPPSFLALAGAGKDREDDENLFFNNSERNYIAIQ